MNNNYNIVITETPSGYYNFILKNDKSSLLFSENYTSRSGCNNGAESLKINAKKISNYTSLKNQTKYFFIVKAANGQILAQSKKYESESKLRNEIEKIILIFENNISIINE
ncbi:DUF1508 domain-containing protein [Chryseobacterium sp. 3008163]|uniref:DUF1508 domain-containing protein n=1 Tax=Chryseobacterium sp. 3008163 TaxID=2478663 RepID=UPI000F0C1CF7|nr:DUF1508 domain-containing protein [Chryseobacterium sp. 3008163]AYN01750.1 DUF1508 domain-containing protein [Chryseobacterium sp. 3008163]